MGERTKVPTALPVNGRVSSNFGTRNSPVKGASTNHKGVDIAVPIGTPVQSTISGTVTVAGNVSGYGKAIYITGSDGVQTRYGHLSQVKVTPGQRITAGEVIGMSGNTGRSSGPHVHYEVRAPNGQPINPTNGSYTGGTAPNIASQTTDQSVADGPAMSIDDQNRIRAELDKDGGYYPNYLNAFHNPNYKIKFFMVSPDVITNVGMVGELSASDLANTLDNAQKVVIAETGVTAGINIKSLTMETFKNGGVAEGSLFTLTLVEPLGTSFYDVTVNASNTLGIQDFKDTPYYLELSFTGYDADGNPIENILLDTSPSMDNGTGCDPLPNQGRWFWQVHFQTVDTSITESGATHVIHLNSTVASNLSTNQDARIIPEMMAIKGNTVGEMLDSLKTQLEESQARRYATTKEPLFLYNFKIDKNPTSGVNDDVRSWVMLSEDYMFMNQSTLSMGDDGKPLLQIGPGTEIAAVLKIIFGFNKEAQRLIANGVVTQNDVVDGASQPRSQVLVNLTSVDVNVRSFNSTWGQYAKTYTYRMVPQYHTTAIADPRQVEEMKDPANQKKMIETLRQKGMFRKRFDYFYTGLNTEVISLDVKFNMAWSAILPNVIGYSVSTAQSITNARYNDNAVGNAQQLAREYAALYSQRKAAAVELAATINNATHGVDTQKLIIENGVIVRGANTIPQGAARDAVIAANRRVSTFDTPLGEARAKLLAAENKIQETDHTPTRTGTGDLVQYAEDLTEPVAAPLAIRLTQASANTGDAVGPGMSQPYHRDRAIFGALMEQLVGATANMMQISMEVRGDPYWLGTANIEENTPPEKSAVAPFHAGGLVFLLKVAYPFNASDVNSDGNLNFRNFESDPEYRQDQFTGFYKVDTISSRFEGGQFTQTINAHRHPMLQVARDVGFGSLDGGELSDEQLQVIYGGQTTPAASTQANEGYTSKGEYVTTSSQKTTQQAIYDQLRAKGWTDEAALTMVAQIGRENSYSPDIMYGTHADAANGKTNYGIVSWQAARGTSFKSYMTRRGFVNPDGTLMGSSAALAAQVDFLDAEMTGKYPGVATAVRTAGQDYNSLEPLISNKYFGWDRTGDNIGSKAASDNLTRMGGLYTSAKNNLRRN